MLAAALLTMPPRSRAAPLNAGGVDRAGGRRAYLPPPPIPERGGGATEVREWVRCAPSARPKSDAGVSCRTARCRARWAGANARAAIGPDIGRVCAVQVKRETAARGGREGMRVQTLWNLLEVVLPVTAEAVADVTRAHAHTQPSQGAHVGMHMNTEVRGLQLCL